MGRRPKNREPNEIEADEDVQRRSNMPGQRDFLHHFNLISQAKQRADDARMKLAGLYSSAQESGFDTKVLKRVLKMKGQDDEKSREEFRTVIQYLKWASSPLGSQLVMFDEPTDDPDGAIRMEGERAGKEGVSANRNPYPERSKGYTLWEEGRMAGQAAILGVTDLNTERKKRGRPPKAVGPTEKAPAAAPAAAPAEPEKKKRGRPRKVETTEGTETLQ